MLLGHKYNMAVMQFSRFFLGDVPETFPKLSLLKMTQRMPLDFQQVFLNLQEDL